MDDEKLREETLFLAVTRPTMWLGVPIEASLPIALTACLTLIITGNPLYAFALAGAFLAVARLIVRHVLPNVLGPIPILAMIGLGEAILIAAGLSFLGMGPQPPSPEWGAMLSDGRGYLRIAWWASILPGLAVTATVISLTVVGRHLQRRFEVRQL